MDSAGESSPVTYEALEPNRLKHLDIIQSVIGRLASNSFLIKGWAITVAAAVFGFALNSSNTLLVLAAVIPTLAFWGLDTYFLRSERLFRALYDEVRSNDNRVAPFFMGATGSKFIERHPVASSWWRSARSLTVALVYGGLLAAALAVAVITYVDDDASARPGHEHSHARHEATHASEHSARMRSAIPSSSAFSS